MLIVAVSTNCQLTPSLDLYPLKVFPLRTSFTQYGAEMELTDVLVVSHPALQSSLERRRKMALLSADRSIEA